jgi:MFS family permease
MVLMRSGRPRRAAASSAAERTPVGISLAAGAVALVAAALVASALPASQPGWRFALIAAVAGGFAGVTLDQRALAGVVLLGWLIDNGFLEDRLGELSWHGSSDIWRMMILVFAAALGLAAGEAGRQIREMRSRWHAEVEGPLLAPDLEEEKARDA